MSLCGPPQVVSLTEAGMEHVEHVEFLNLEYPLPLPSPLISFVPRQPFSWLPLIYSQCCFSADNCHFATLCSPPDTVKFNMTGSNS